MKKNTLAQNPEENSKQIKYLRWGIVLLLTLGIINSYLDRMNMSFAASAISREFGHWVQVFQFWRSDATEISSSVAIDQDAAILAGEFDGLNQRGSLAYLLTHQDTGWVETASLQPDSAPGGVLKTKAIALDENYAIISSVSDSSGSGVVFIARRSKKEGTDKNQIQWRIQQQLLPTEPPIGLNFGEAVAIRNDYALVGAPAKTEQAISGAVFIFHRQDDHWVQEAKLTVENTTAPGQFGQSVALVEDAVLVGNSAEEQGRGAVYVFQHQKNDWIQIQKLMRADAQTNDHFGQLLSADGKYALVTAPDAERHASRGTAYIFQRNEDEWKLQAELVPDDSLAINQFGISAALAGNYAMVGVATGPKAGTTGIVFMYHREGRRWVQQSRLIPSDSTIFNFGSAVALSDDKFAIVGAIKKRTALDDTLSASIYKHIPVDPAQMGLILAMFFWMYGLLQVPAGRLVDKYGIRKLYTLSYLIWGFVATAFGLATSIWMFIVLRALLGILESVSAPASMAFIGTHFNEKERGLASGLYLSGTKFGPSIGGILAAWLIDSYGWRMLFILCGLVPLLWLAPWEYYYRKLESRLKK
ncbi:MFS transporter, partial [candidate division KSB1 bacterium]|nr:MFS transporter [candidate division KSB1 bacterium]